MINYFFKFSFLKKVFLGKPSFGKNTLPFYTIFIFDVLLRIFSIFVDKYCLTSTMQCLQKEYNNNV